MDGQALAWAEVFVCPRCKGGLVAAPRTPLFVPIGEDRSVTHGSSQQGTAVIRRSLDEDRLQMVLHHPAPAGAARERRQSPNANRRSIHLQNHLQHVSHPSVQP